MKKAFWLVLLLALPMGCTPAADEGDAGSGSTAAAPAENLSQQG